MITAEQIKEMIALEARRIIREELTLEFDSSYWMCGNRLRIELMLGEEPISSITLSYSDIPEK